SSAGTTGRAVRYSLQLEELVNEANITKSFAGHNIRKINSLDFMRQNPAHRSSNSCERAELNCLPLLTENLIELSERLVRSRAKSPSFASSTGSNASRHS